MAKSEVGRGWENVADNLIAKKRAGTIAPSPEYTSRYPWFDKVDPDSMIYKTQGDFNKYTGMDHVMDMAGEIASNAPLAVRAIKRMMRAAETETFEQNVHHVFLQLLPLFRTKDFKEGVAAFIEKRPPNFIGR